MATRLICEPLMYRNYHDETPGTAGIDRLGISVQHLLVAAMVGARIA